MRYLNLGCGQRFHTHWINVDFTPTGPGVIVHNLTQGIPFPDAYFDVVYHSHILEHFSKSQASSFLKECCRVLQPQGTIRIAIPDLEQIIRSYIVSLEQAISGSQAAADNYQWLLLELFDQMVRNQSGGDMATYLFQEHIPNEAFIFERLGTEAKNLVAAGRQHRKTDPASVSRLKQILESTYKVLRHPRESFLKLALGSVDYKALQIGRFRQGGEVHQWMYDRYSITQLLKKCGFEQITQCSAHESCIPNWISFHLDTEPDGSIYKPDSLFIEAIKPRL